MKWGSCYTYSWVYDNPYYMARSDDCRNCGVDKIDQAEQALAIQALPNATFQRWHNIVSQMATAPDEAGWAQQGSGSCKIVTAGHNANTQLSATYSITLPSKSSCDERHSAMVMPGVFVNAPHLMGNGSAAAQRCPMPMDGQVTLQCTDGVLSATGNNSCASRSSVDLTTKGYFRMLRGHNYHGIETGSAFAVAEMSHFQGLCPTTGWIKWSSCNATMPCYVGMQTRTRQPIAGKSQTDLHCIDLDFFQSRSCVGPGFCDEVLARFMQGTSHSIASFEQAYKSASTSLPNPTAGVQMLTSAYQTCSEAQRRCELLTGKSHCSMLFQGHFKVKKGAAYRLRFDASEGG